MWTHEVGGQWCHGRAWVWQGICCCCCHDEQVTITLTLTLTHANFNSCSRHCFASGCWAILILHNVWKKIKLIILMDELDPGLLTQSLQNYPALVYARISCVCCVCCFFFICRCLLGCCTNPCQIPINIGRKPPIIPLPPFFIEHACSLFDKCFYNVDWRFLGCCSPFFQMAFVSFSPSLSV